MTLKTKDFASLGGLILVGVVAFFLAFTPDLVRENHLTLPQAVWIAFALTIMSLVCFGIEKYESSNEEREREKSELARDKRMEEIAERMKDMQDKLGGLSETQRMKLEHAQKMYSMLIEAAGKPPETLASLIDEAIKNGPLFTTLVNPAIFQGAWRYFEILLKAKWTGKREDRDKIRKTADSLMLSALGVEDKDLPIA
jgi:hypothetical protein